MRPAALAGVILIVAGALMLAYQGFTYTTRKKVVDIGPIQATAKTRKTVDLPPILGATALVGGVVLLVLGVRKR